MSGKEIHKGDRVRFECSDDPDTAMQGKEAKVLSDHPRRQKGMWHHMVQFCVDGKPTGPRMLAPVENLTVVS